MDKILISVIIPVYNSERFIADTLNSIFRQNHKNLEIIVVNDGSTDNTLNVLKSFGDKIKIISQENKGQAVARNVGIKNARGSIIGFIDADDIWPDNRTEIMLPHLLDENGYDFVRGLTQYCKNIGTPQEEYSGKKFMEVLIGSCLYKRSLFNKVGLFDEDMREGEDLDWNIRIEENGLKEKRIEETTLLYRRHDRNLTRSKDFIARGQINSFRKKFARARNKKI